MENTNMFVKQVSASGSFGSQFREFVASKQVNTQQTSHALYGNASSSHYRASYLFAPDTPQRPITEKNDSVTEPQCATDVKLKRQKKFHRSQGVSNVAHKYSSIIPGYNPRKFRAQHTDASNANKHSFTESSDFASGSFGSQFRQFVSNTQFTHTSRAPRTCSPYAHKHPAVTIPSSESHKSKLVNFSSPIQSSLSETSHSINEEVLHLEEHPPEAHEHSCSTGNNEFYTLQTDASDGDRSRREKLSSVAHLNIRTACAKSANTSDAHQRSSIVDITCASHLQKSCTSHNYASGTESGTNQHPFAEGNDYIPRPYLHTNEPDGKYESLCPPRNDTGKRKHMPVNATVTESVSLQFGAPCTQYSDGGQCVSITEPEYASRSIRTEGYVSDLQPRESSHTSRNNTAGSHQHSLTRKNDSCKPAPKSRIPLLVSNFFESSNSVHSHRSRFSRKSPSHGSKSRSVFRDLTNLKAAKLNDSSTFFARANHDYPNLSNSLLLENSTSKRPAAQTAHDKLQNSIKLFGAPDPSEFNKVNTIRAHSLNVSQAKSMSGESTRNWDLENEERLSSPRIGYQNLNNIPEAHARMEGCLKANRNLPRKDANHLSQDSFILGPV